MENKIDSESILYIMSLCGRALMNNNGTISELLSKVKELEDQVKILENPKPSTKKKSK